VVTDGGNEMLVKLWCLHVI